MGIESLGPGADAASINTKAITSGVGSTPLVESGPASAMSSITSPISGAVDSVGNFFKGLTGGTQVKLPLPNVLSSYATYNYIIGIGALSQEDYTSHSYIKGKQIPLICKSGSIDPDNRVLTAYGKFEYYIDNVSIDSLLGCEGLNTNVSTMSFDIIEPYSMGLFLLSVQTAALNAGFKNWRDGLYLMTIEFRGNKETGQMLNISEAKRYIPFMFTNMQISTKESGTVYQITAYAPNEVAKTTEYNARSDVAIKGKTVQEVLQTGEKSLQVVINNRLKQHVKDKTMNEPDEILILFPQTASGGGNTEEDNKESKDSATAKPNSGKSGSSIEKELGVTRSKSTGNLVQPNGQCNELGNAKLGFNSERRADTPMSKDNAVYDKKTDVWVRGNNSVNLEENNFKFAQNASIIDMINEVLLMSEYPDKALKADALDSNGMRTWWDVNTQVYYKDSEANLAKTGKKPRILVYRVTPKKRHSSRSVAPNAKAPGIENLKKNIVKVYEYIYTGHNTEILKFNIDFSVNFSTAMQADTMARSQDHLTKDDLGNQAKPNKTGFFSFLEELIAPVSEGFAPETEVGSVPSSAKHDATSTRTDKKGGGGTETNITRAARTFHDAITNQLDMIMLDLDIMGDPYWINQSGLGTYIATPVAKNLNDDNTVDYLNSEVHILITFRTPVDINQPTGFYTFGGASSTAPVIQFTGLYLVNKVVSSFSKGQFRQTLTGSRIPNQEKKTEDSGINTFNIDNIFKGLF